MACLGAKNITVWFQEAELREQELRTPKDVLARRQDLEFHAHASLLFWGCKGLLLLKPCAWASWFFTTVTLVKFGSKLYCLAFDFVFFLYPHQTKEMVGKRTDLFQLIDTKEETQYTVSTLLHSTMMGGEV